MSQLAPIYSIKTGRRIEASEIPTPKELNMFEEFDRMQTNIQNRYEDHLPKQGTVYKQKLTKNTNSFDSYGYGCVHNSVHQYMPRRGEIWNKPMPMPADLRQIDAFLRSHSGKVLRLGLKSDPFMWMDHKYGMTKSVIRLANQYKVSLVIHTLSDLCAHEDYLDLIKAGDHLVVMQMGLSCEKLEHLASPGGPSNARRERTIEILKSAGVEVSVVAPRAIPVNVQMKRFGGVYVDDKGLVIRILGKGGAR